MTTVFFETVLFYHCSLFLQTGFSGNMIILSVFYYGGIMMNESQITVGELSSFLLYAAFVGVSIGG
jgi:ATP-binding cassette subfamily B (MDR/TAP) protein 10